MTYTGRDLARDTYAGIDMQPAKRTIVAPQPVQPISSDSRKEVAAQYYATKSIRSWAERHGRAPSHLVSMRLAANAAALVDAMYPSERDA